MYLQYVSELDTFIAIPKLWYNNGRATATLKQDAL